MKQKISASSVFMSGAARFKDLIYLVTRDKKLDAEEVDHSRFIAFDQGKLGHMGDFNWNTAAVCVARKPAEKFVAVGEDGEVFTFVAGKEALETISPKPIALRGVGVVDGYPVACGMKRQVYRRAGEGTWTAMHAPSPEGKNHGFEDIGGFGGNEMYAAGWKGEIWEWDGKKWHNRPSPTNLILTGICCAGDGQVYICGQNGTLIRGRHDTWEVVDLDPLKKDFWDIHWFNDRLYLATMTGLFTLGSSGPEPVDFGAEAPSTCYRLTDAQGVLFSVGSADVFSFDGSIWKRED